MLRNDTPLFLPPGSVRSILALVVIAGFLLGQVSEDIAFIVLGFYFVSRAAENRTPRA